VWPRANQMHANFMKRWSPRAPPFPVCKRLVNKPNYFSKHASRHTGEAIESLLENVKVRLPKSGGCHLDLDIHRRKKIYGARRFGTLYYACWMEERKPQDGPMVSREMLSSYRTFNVCARFIGDIQTMNDELSFLYAAASPHWWRCFVDKNYKLQKHVLSIRMLGLSKYDPWSSAPSANWNFI
jgi:hypothetical protein